jgi:hypothetical protein
MNSLCTTPWESKKLSTRSWSGTFGISISSAEGMSHPFRTLSLCSGVIGKTPGLTSRNNFVEKIFVCIGHRDNVLARCDSIFPLLRCQGVWNKTCTQISLSQILFQNPKNYSVGTLKHSAIILDAIWRSFFIKSATAAMFTSVRVHFGRPPLSSSSTSSLLSQNQEYLKMFDLFRASFP